LLAQHLEIVQACLPVLALLLPGFHGRPDCVAMFRLLGGGVLGDLAPMPPTQFAVLPGTSHIGVTSRADMLMTMLPPFLDAP